MSKDKRWQPRYELSELFDEQTVAELMAVARLRIIAAFDHATEYRRGHLRGTDNYIGCLGPRQKELVEYVMENRLRCFVTINHLPDELRLELHRHRQQLQRIARQAQYDTVAMVIAEMCHPQNGLIWYEETHGLWCILPSVVDEYRLALHAARRAFKFDRRNEHGQVRSQRIRRGRPAGVSTSLAGDRMVV